jgi:hypothetical protein
MQHLRLTYSWTCIIPAFAITDFTGRVGFFLPMTDAEFASATTAARVSGVTHDFYFLYSQHVTYIASFRGFFLPADCVSGTKVEKKL